MRDSLSKGAIHARGDKIKIMALLLRFFGTSPALFWHLQTGMT